MEKKTEKGIALFVLYGEKEPEEVVKSLKEAGVSDIEIIAFGSSLRPAAYFPFIKDEEGRPYYGREGISFYLRRLKERK